MPITTTVRSALNVGGHAVSLKDMANQRGTALPVSVRNFIGAPPAGRVTTRIVPLALLQQKLDTFLNRPDQPPLFKVRLHNIGSGDHRHSTVDVRFNDPARHGYVSQLPDEQPKDLGQLEIDLPLAPNPDFHFNDL